MAESDLYIYMDSALLAILAFAVFLTAYFLGMCTTNPYLRRRWKHKIMCTFGKHHPDRIKAEVGGRSVQRCLYCDKVVHEYQVTTPAGAKRPITKKIY